MRNQVRYTRAAVPLEPGRMAETEILARLVLAATGMHGADPEAVDAMVVDQTLGKAVTEAHSPVHGRDPRELAGLLTGDNGPERRLDMMLRLGPYGDGFGARTDGLSLERLLAHPHGIDLGPLRSRLPQPLKTVSGKVELLPRPIADDLPRLKRALGERADGLVLVGRRHLRSNNSWLHNVPALTGGSNRCTLHIHPSDAERLGLVDGARVRVKGAGGAVTAPVEFTEGIRPGVVSLPHGWGHDRPGTRMSHASLDPGVNVNQLLDGSLLDRCRATRCSTAFPWSSRRSTHRADRGVHAVAGTSRVPAARTPPGTMPLPRDGPDGRSVSRGGPGPAAPRPAAPGPGVRSSPPGLRAHVSGGLWRTKITALVWGRTRLRGPGGKTMKAHDGMYIDGAWRPAAGPDVIEVVNPLDEQVVGRVPAGTADDVDAAVRAARAAFPSWAATSPAERAARLRALRDVLVARKDEIAETVTAELGAPLPFSQSVHVGMPILVAGSYAELAATHVFEERIGNSVGPPGADRGRGAITPGTPPHQIVAKVAPALAGCTVVLKPAEDTPLTAQIFAEASMSGRAGRGVQPRHRPGPGRGPGARRARGRRPGLLHGSPRSAGRSARRRGRRSRRSRWNWAASPRTSSCRARTSPGP